MFTYFSRTKPIIYEEWLMAWPKRDHLKRRGLTDAVDQTILNVGDCGEVGLNIDIQQIFRRPVLCFFNRGTIGRLECFSVPKQRIFKDHQQITNVNSQFQQHEL